MFKIKNIICFIFFASSLLCSEGCKKLIDVDPPKTSVTGATVYNSDANAAAVLTGIYINTSRIRLSSGSSIASFMTLYPGLSADEFTLYSGSTVLNLINYYKNSLSNNYGPNCWTNSYTFLYICNEAIGGITKSNSLTPSVKQQLLGEAKFLRAFYYFYLVNLYGDVPLILTTDYTANAIFPRTPKDQVYDQIITDLKDAQTKLSDQFLEADIITPSADRVRPTSWAATALLARVYLYKKDWANAETESGKLINNTSLFSLSDIDKAFLKAQNGNNEAIWQLQPVNIGWNTEDARFFVITGSGPNSSHPVYLSNFLLNSFEPADLRKSHWINSVTTGGNTYYYPYKYKISAISSDVTEHQVVLRLGEQFLIRAEARAQQNNPDGATADLNSIRARAGLPDYAGPSDKDSVIAAILHERQVELFAEWGNRWLDLKRTGTADAVMNVVTPQKGGTWNSNWQLYPISALELTADPKLTQNPGY